MNLMVSRAFSIAAAGPRVIRVGEVPGSNPGAPILESPLKQGFLLFRDRSCGGLAAHGGHSLPKR